MNASATMDGITDQATNGTHRFGRAARRGAGRMKRNAPPDIASLIADVEGFLQKVGHIADDEVAQLRDRLNEKIAGAKETLGNRRAQLAGVARNAAGATDDYVHENPWRSTGVATLIGLALGYVIFRR
jgi:ElaB/YqjD/DUF883 family membrane-anchored ribosome-binding protein